MQGLSLVAILLWAASFGMNVLLLAVLVAKKRWRVVPWFTGWILFSILTTAVLYFGRRYGSTALYRGLYWGSAFLDVVLQLAVIVEIAGFVFRRGEAWVGNTRKRLAASAVVVAAVAVVLAFSITPAADSARDALYSRASLFVTILVTGLFMAVMAVSQQAGVSWQNLVIREGLGFLVLNLVSFITDTLHAYWRTAEHFGDLEHLRIACYIGTLAYWIVVFWLPNKTPSVVDEKTRKALRDLRSELESKRVN